MALVSTMYPPEVWAIESLMVLRDNLLMAGLVHRDFENEVAQAGDTVRTRKPTKLTVQDFAQQSGTNATLANMTVQNLNAREITVVLDKHKYTAFIVEDRDEATSIKDLRDEFIVPAIDPISQQVDDDVMDEFQNGTDYAGNPVVLAAAGTIGAGNALDENDLIEADRVLNAQQCPRTPRNVVLGTQHNADVIGRPLFHQANTAGSTEALRNANLGRAFGFDTFMSQNVPTGNNTDNAGQNQSYGFHRNVLALVTRPLQDIPGGLGAISSVQTIDNIGVRVTTSYEHTAKGVVMSFDILYGLQLLDANLGVILAP
jgi:hypothetical protein